jgi:hypothetical protein
MAENTVTFGLPADEIVERNSGGLEHRAIALTDLASSLYTVAEAFAYDDGP